MRPHHPLKVWRFERGVSQKALAGIVGVTGAFICLVEGRNREPSADVARRIAAHTGLSLDQIYELPAADSSPKSGG